MIKKEQIKTKLEELKEIRHSKWLSVFGDRIHHSFLFSLNRRSVSRGAAIGIFFALMIPVAQIPIVVIASIFLRANIPVAVLATFVTNPFTTPFILMAAWYVGMLLTGDSPNLSLFSLPSGDDPDWIQWIKDMGEPLIFGVSFFAVTLSFLFYFLASYFWKISVLKRRKESI